VCAAACRGIEIIQQEPWRRQRLSALAERLRSGVNEAGLSTIPNGIGPIVPVLLNDPTTAVSSARLLEDRGFLVAAIRPPTVPPGTSRLRITLSCAHSEEDIAHLLQALSDVLKS
jgi:8-amino-7-oxononanoate synthase